MDFSIKPKIYVSTQNPSIGLSQDFMICKINNVPCAYCGREMTTSKYLRELFGDDSEIGTDCIDRAREYGNLLSSKKQQILNFLTQTQFLNRLTTDNQILRTAIKDSVTYLRNDILQRFEDIIRIVKKSSLQRAKDYLIFNEERNREFFTRNADYCELIKFVRGEGFLNIPSKPKDKSLEEINAIIKDIEEDKDQYPEAYLIRRATYKSPSDFYIDLFEKTLSSVDHVIPKSKGGTNIRRNFLAVCRDCNEKKGSVPLPVFMASDCRIKPNIENQLKFLIASIPKYIAERKLTQEYLSYPYEISENLNAITGGKLDLIR